MLQVWCKQQLRFEGCLFKYKTASMKISNNNSIQAVSGQSSSVLVANLRKQGSLRLFALITFIQTRVRFQPLSSACMYYTAGMKGQFRSRSRQQQEKRCILLASIVTVLIMKFDYNFLPAWDPLSLISLVQMLPVPGDASLTGFLSTDQQSTVWYVIQNGSRCKKKT